MAGTARPRAYDGDSLAALPEEVALGTAAAVHLAGSEHGPAATPEQVREFAQAYQHRRGRLDASSVAATAAWTVAYNAACDAALGQSGGGSFLAACLSAGDRYLA